MCITSKFSLRKLEGSSLNNYSNTKVFLIAQLGLMGNKCQIKKNESEKKKINQSSDSSRKEISKCSHHITYRLELNINTIDTFSSTSPFVGLELEISFLEC